MARKAPLRYSKPKVRGINILKDNKKYGQKMTDYESSVVGNHIRTDVGMTTDIQEYLSYASTDSVPYLITTRSKYDLLAPRRKDIVQKLSDDYESHYHYVVDPLVQRILDEGEEEKIVNYFTSTNNSFTGGADDILAQINGLQLVINGLTGNIGSIITQVVDPWPSAWWHFASFGKVLNGEGKTDKEATRTYRNKFYGWVADSINNDKDGSEIFKNATDDFDNNINANREDGEIIIENLETSLSFISDVYGNTSFFEKNARNMSRKLGYLYTTAARSVNQFKSGGMMSVMEFSKFDKGVKEIYKKVDQSIQANSGGKALKIYSKSYNPNLYGFIAEDMTNAVVSLLLDSLKSGKSLDNAAAGKKLVIEIKKGALQEGLKNIGADPKSSKTIDSLSVSINEKTGKKSVLTMDQKFNRAAAIKKAGGFVYSSGTTVDLQKAYQSLMQGGKNSPEILRLYRAMMLNVSAEQGYNLWGNPREAEIYFKEALSVHEGQGKHGNADLNQDNFDFKFKSEDSSETGSKLGYPMVVVLNGKFYRFSDVIKNMAKKGAFTSELEDKDFMIAQPNPLSKTEVSQLYKDKLAAGDSNKRTRGFAGVLSGKSEHQAIVNRIEDSYFRSLDKTTKRVKFYITVN